MCCTMQLYENICQPIPNYNHMFTVKVQEVFNECYEKAQEEMDELMAVKVSHCI